MRLLWILGACTLLCFCSGFSSPIPSSPSILVSGRINYSPNAVRRQAPNASNLGSVDVEAMNVVGLEQLQSRRPITLPPHTLSLQQLVYLSLTSTFITCLFVADVIGVKVFELKLPFSIFGRKTVEHTCGMLTFPITFILGDVINEYFGAQATRTSVYIGFVMSIIVFLAMNLAQAMPFLDKPFNGTSPSPVACLSCSLPPPLELSSCCFFFLMLIPSCSHPRSLRHDLRLRQADVCGFRCVSFSPSRLPCSLVSCLLRTAAPSTHLSLWNLFPFPACIASAYLIGQLMDIWLFGVLKRWTKGRMLWLRATGSTVFSQMIDSFFVSYIAFSLGKSLTNQVPATMPEVLQIAVTGYALKFVMAGLLTPALYLTRHIMHTYFGLEPLPADCKAAEC